MNIGNIRIDSLNDRASQILEGDHTIVISYNTAKSMNKGDILFTSNVNLHTCEKNRKIIVCFLPLVIDHNPGCRIWPSLAHHFITQVMIYNLGYDQ